MNLPPADSDDDALSFAYEGPAALRQGIAAALRTVFDPEVGLSIVELGLVYAVRVEASQCAVEMTMTSAACPMGDLIVADVERALAAVLPAELPPRVALVWEPPWTPERMSDSARRAMGW